MKRFLSYLMVFISLFAISTTMTIKSKSDLLQNKPTTNAGASAPTTLLSGVMESIESNPKLNIKGEISAAVEETAFGVGLDVNLDLTNLTNPTVEGSVVLEINDKAYNILFAYVENVIYVSNGNINLQLNVSEITSLTGVFAAVVGEDVSLPEISMPEINVDSLMAALTNPIKTVVDGKNFYQVSLPNIAKLTIVCDDNFNISSISIDEVYLIEGATVDCDLFVGQDSNIAISAPSENHFMNVSEVLKGLTTLNQKEYLKYDAWANLYGGKGYIEGISTDGVLSFPQNRYSIAAKLYGELGLDLSVEYNGEEIFAKINQLGVKASLQDINDLIDLLSEEDQSNIQTSQEVTELTTQLTQWLSNNYDSLLSGAVVTSNQILLSADMTGILGQTGRVDFTLKLKDNQITSISFSKLTIGDIKVYATIHLRELTEYNFTVDKTQYYPLENVFAVLDWVKDVQTINVSTSLELTQQQNTLPLDLAISYNTQNNDIAVQTNMFDLPINIYLVGGGAYINVQDSYLLANQNLIMLALNQLMPSSEATQQVINKMLDIAKELSVQEILTILNVSTNSEYLFVKADLSVFTGKTFIVDLQVSFNNGFEIIVNNLTFDDIFVNGTINVSKDNSQIVIANPEQYLDVEGFVDYVQSFISAPELQISGIVDLSHGEQSEQFDGTININFEDFAARVSGELSGEIQANIDIVYKEDAIYLQYNNQKFAVGKNQLGLLLERFNINIQPIFDYIDTILETKANLDIKQTVGGLANGSVEIDQSLTLEDIKVEDIVEIIKSIAISSTNIQAKLGDNVIDVVLGENLGTNITIAADQFEIAADLEISKQAGNYTVDQNYIDLDLAMDTVHGMFNIVEDNHFEGTINFSWGTSEEQTVSADYNLNIVNNKIYAKIQATYLGETVTIDYIDGEVYIAIKEVYVKATLLQLENLAKQYLPQEIQDQILDMINQSKEFNTEKLLAMIYQITTTDIIDSLSKEDNVLYIELFDATISFETTNSKLSKVCGSYGAYVVSATISSNKQAAAIAVDQSKYVDIDTVHEMVVNTIDYVSAGEFNFTVVLKAAGYTVSGYINISDSVSANLSTTIYGKKLNLIVSDNVIYINFDGLVAYVNFKDIPSLVEEVKTQFNIEIPEEILEIISTVFAEDSQANISNIAGSLIGDEKPTIKELLNSIDVALTKDLLVVTYGDVKATVAFGKNKISGVKVEYMLSEAEKIVATLIISEYQAVTVPLGGINIADLKDLIEHVIPFVKTQNYAGTLDFEGYGLNFDGSYKLVVKEGILSAQIETCFYGLDTTITLIDKAIYVSVGGLKIYGSINEINNIIHWINDAFNQEIKAVDLSLVDGSKKQSPEEALAEFDFSKLILSIVGNIISASYDDISVNLTVDSIINAQLKYDELVADLTVSVANNSVSVNSKEYLHYSALTNLVDSVLEVYNNKKLQATATAHVYEGSTMHYTAVCQVQIDMVDKRIYISVDVTDELTKEVISVMFAFDGSYWYVDYDGLKLKINKKDLAEILAMVLDFVGIDASLLPFLSDVTSGLDINMDNLAALTPELDFGDPLGMLKIIQQISLTNNSLALTIDNVIMNNPHSDTMTATLTTNNGSLSSVALTNIFTGQTRNEYLNMSLVVGTFEGVSEPNEGKYFDISGSNELIKAVINTAELNYFEITGNIKLEMYIVSIIDIDWTIPINIKVRLDENRKPEIMITLGKIPAVLGVNNDVPYKYGDTESSENRMWYIYYKDSYTYMLREDRVDYYRPPFSAGTRTYQKTLKSHIDSVMDDFFWYLQWGVGFTDKIMNEIEKALALSDNHNPSLDKVINDFVNKDGINYSIDINLQEISNNPQVKNMVVGIGVVNNESTGYKNYVGNANLYLHMPISEGAFEIDLSSYDLMLINIGQSFDFSAFETFVGNYSGAEGLEYDRTWDDGKSQPNWTKSAERQYTLYFEENGGGAVSDIVATAGSPISLPTPADKVELVGSNKDVYKFAGWYTSDTLLDAYLFTDNVMPRRDTTLYAKWEIKEQYRQLNFYVDGQYIGSQNAVIGTAIKDWGIAQTKEVVNGNQKEYQKFVGWTDSNGNIIEKITANSQSVYAKYETYLTLTKYNLSFNTSVADPIETVQVYNTDSIAYYLVNYSQELIINSDGITRHYQFQGWFDDSSFTTPASLTMPANDHTVYAKWVCVKELKQYKLTIYDGSTTYTDLYQEESDIVLPSTLKNDSNTRWYTNSSFTTAYAFDGKMPAYDLTLYVRNLYTLTYSYYAKENNIFVLKENQTKTYYQGESINCLPSQTNSTLEYGSGDSYYRVIYTFNGYFSGSTQYSNGSVMPNTDVSVVSQVSTQKQYKVTFDTRLYTPNSFVAGGHWKNGASFTPEAIYVNEGGEINLNSSSYQPTAKGYLTAVENFFGDTAVTFKVTSWGTSAWSKGTKGGSGKNEFTVNSSMTLYACWEKQ